MAERAHEQADANERARELIQRAYEAFNARDIDAALATMHSDVDWPNGMDGGRVHGRAALHEYWTRQFGLIDSRVEPEAIRQEPGGIAVVRVHQLVRDTTGNLISDGHVTHTYLVRDGLIRRMDIDGG